MANPIKKAINKTWEERKMWWDFFGGLPLLLNYNKPQYGGGKQGGAGAGSLFVQTTPEYELVKDTLWIPIQESYNEAFANARKKGLKTFMFNGELKNTELGNDPKAQEAGSKRFQNVGLIPIERTKKIIPKKDNSVKKHQEGGLIAKFQKPAGGIHLVGKSRSSGIREWFKEWWNNYPKDYSGRMCALDAKGNPTGECAKYSNDVLKSKGYTSIGDAWTRIPFSGAKVLYTGYDSNLPETYNNETYTQYINDAADRFAEKVDTTKLRDYDIIGMTSMGSPSQEKAYNAGKKHGRLNTHTGHIRVGEDGTHYVVHNVHNNVYQHKLADLL